MYAATSETGEACALKLLNPVSLLDPRARERFRREGEALRRIAHPHIVAVREVGIHEGQPYLTMDRVPGRSLAERLAEIRGAKERGDPLPRWHPDCADSVRGAVALATQLAHALVELHAAGLLHRDLKPENIVVTESGEAVLVDFGLATDERFATLTHTGDVLGTLSYMAPEQARGERVDVRADLYGLGAILHELLTLEPPHGDVKSLTSLREVAEGSASPLGPRTARIPRPLRKILYRLLAYSPTRRYASASALVRDLEAWSRGERVLAAPPSPAERVADFGRQHRRTTRLTLAAAVVLIGIATTLGITERSASRERAFEAHRLGATNAYLDRDEARFANHVEGLSDLHPEAPASRFFTALFENDPAHLPEAPEWRQLYSGIELRKKRDPAGIEVLERATRNFPGWALPSFELGRLARFVNESAIALREFTAAARLAPASARAQYELARILHESKDDTLSIGPARRATQLAPEDAASWLLRARICYTTKQFEEALTAAKEAYRLSEAREQSALRTLAVGLTSNGFHLEALELLEQLLEIDPQNAATLFSIALVEDTLEHHAEARDWYRRVLSVDPRNARAMLSLAHYHSGSNPECSQCNDYFRVHPRELDPTLAATLVFDGLAIDQGSDPQVLDTAIGVMGKLGRLVELIPPIEELRDRTTSDRQVVNLQRALRRIRELLEARASAP